MIKRVCRYLIALLLAIVSPYIASAGTEGIDHALLSESSILPDSVISSHQHFKIAYRVNRHNLDTAYMANRKNIDRMRIAFSNPDAIDSIVVYSFASPEGPLQNNLRLARGRGDKASMVITDLLNEDGVHLDDEKIKIRIKGENWEDLHTAIQQHKDAPRQQEILKILENDKLTQAQKKRAVRNLGWKTWRYIIDKVMPRLRTAEIVCYFHNDMYRARLKAFRAELLSRPMQTVSIAQAPQPPELNEALVQQAAPAEQEEYIQEKRTRIAAKTNMLYDAAMWTNISAEVPFQIKGQKFSVTYDHQFPWWRWGKGNNRYCNRYLQIGGEARWWFAPQKKPRTKHDIKRECLAGHFVGLYGMGGKYDFEWGRKICYQGEFWSAGLTYGYSMPISRLFNLEFSVSLGFASIVYRHFIPSEDYGILYRDVDKMGTLDYFGVTKLGVTLVMPINFKHKSKVRKELRL